MFLLLTIVAFRVERGDVQGSSGTMPFSDSQPVVVRAEG
jgi:hypothetical protein